MSLDKVAAEPLTVAVNGQEYKLGRIRLCDLGAVAARLRAQRLNALLGHQAQIPRTVLADALGALAARDPNDEDIWEYIGSPLGMRFMLWRALTQHQPAMKEDDVDAIIAAEPSIFALLMKESQVAAPPRAVEPDPETDAEESQADPFPVFGKPQPAPQPTGGAQYGA